MTAHAASGPSGRRIIAAVEPQDAPVAGSPLDIEREIVDSLYAAAKGRAEAARALAQTQERMRARNMQLHESALRAVSEATRSAVGEAHRQHAEELAALEARAKARAEKVKLDEATIRREAENRAEQLEENTQRRYDEAVWMAESVYEAAIPVIRKAAQKRLDELELRARGLEELVNAGHAQVRRFRQRTLSDPKLDASQMARAATLGGNSDEPMRELAVQLEHLKACRAAGLFRGPILLIPLLVLVGAGVPVGALVAENEHWTLGAGAAVGIGAALLVFLMCVLVLYTVARREVRRAYTPFLATAALARQALMLGRQECERARREKEDHATAVRDADLTRAENVYRPTMAEIDRKMRDVLARIDERAPRYRAKVHELRASELAAAHVAKDEALSEAEHRERTLQTEERGRLASVIADLDASAAAESQAQAEAWKEMQARTLAGFDSLRALNAQCAPAWTDKSWETWEPPTRQLPAVRVGQLHLHLDQVPEAKPADPALAWPDGTPDHWLLPAFLGAAGRMSLVVDAVTQQRDAGLSILQNALARILVSIPPGKARFTLIDPIGLGQSFAGFMHLADEMELLVTDRIWTDPRHIEQKLADLTDHMELVIQKHLRNEYATIEEYNIQAGEIAEPLRFLVMADFPTNITEQAAKRFASILQSGARCGVHVLLLRDMRAPLPPGLDPADLRRHAVTITWKESPDGGRWLLDEGSIGRLPFDPDPPPTDAFLQRITQIVGRVASGTARVEVPFTSVAPRPADRWTLSSANNLRIPIGRSGASRIQHLLLGEGTSQHALVAGKTGSGKSSLLNALIVNAALWYPPEELEFWLVDFKKGVEFKAYASHHLPHARAVAVESDREFGLSVLQGLDDELKRRGELFRMAGVQNLSDWRALGRPEHMPRSLLVIDEFQELFIEDDKVAQDSSLLLDRLVRQGRAFGMHVVLGSQTLGGAYSLARSTMGQMGVRIALQCTEADSQLILSDDNTAARLLSRPGEAIYNDAGGLVEGNNPFQVVWIADTERDTRLDEVHALDCERRAGVARPRPIVFEGNAAADPLANAPLLRALDQSEPGRQAFAPLLWMGDAVSIKDPTAAVMVRRTGANVAIVGQRDEGAAAILAMAMMSIAAQCPVQGTRIVVLDGTTPDDRLHGALARVAKALPHDVQIPPMRDCADAMLALGQELARRTAAGAGDAPGIFLLVNGLHRFRILRRSEDDFGYGGATADAPATPDRVLGLLLKEGPLVGIHSVLWADTVANLQRSVDRNSLRELEWKALFQMSATDSSTLIDAPTASRLGFHRALLANEESGLLEKFRPYAFPDDAFLQMVSERLRGRK